MIYKTETLRAALRVVIGEERFGDMSVTQVIGVLEILKFELITSLPEVEP